VHAPARLEPHAYHITNIEEERDGTGQGAANYTQPGLNNFRQNKQPGSEFAAPDANRLGGPALLSATTGSRPPCGTSARPRCPRGSWWASTRARAERTLLGASSTVKVLYSAESEWSSGLPDAPLDVKNGVVPVYAVADDTAGARTRRGRMQDGNNTSQPVKASCDEPQ
jgi:hypothetical protein